MDTRPLRIFLVGTALAVGAVVGLAPTSDARTVSINPPLDGPPISVPELEPPDWQFDPCLITACDEPDWEIFDDCLVVPGLCDPPADDPQDHAEPTDTPDDKPDRPRLPEPDRPKRERPDRPKNPDVVQTHPTFTG